MINIPTSAIIKINLIKSDFLLVSAKTEWTFWLKENKVSTEENTHNHFKEKEE